MKNIFLLIVFCANIFNLFCPVDKHGIRYVYGGGSCQTLLMSAVQHGEDAGVDDFLTDPYTLEQLRKAREWAQGKLEGGYGAKYNERLRNIIAMIQSKEKEHNG